MHGIWFWNPFKIFITIKQYVNRKTKMLKKIFTYPNILEILIKSYEIDKISALKNVFV